MASNQASTAGAALPPRRPGSPIVITTSGGTEKIYVYGRREKRRCLEDWAAGRPTEAIVATAAALGATEPESEAQPAQPQPTRARRRRQRQRPDGQGGSFFAKQRRAAKKEKAEAAAKAAEGAGAPVARPLPSGVVSRPVANRRRASIW